MPIWQKAGKAVRLYMALQKYKTVKIRFSTSGERHDVSNYGQIVCLFNRVFSISDHNFGFNASHHWPTGVLGQHVDMIFGYPPLCSGNTLWRRPLCNMFHDDVIKWKHFPRNWPFVRGIHRSPVNSPHKGQWRGALMFSLICARINGWVNNGEAGDLRRYRAHYGVIIMRIRSGVT